MDTALRKDSAGDERVTPITLFAVPKPFRGHIGIIQRNAIQSWTLLDPRPEIILLGDEEGIAETAAELGARHVRELARNEFGTPLLNDVFEKARRLASSPLLCYVNADIILLDDFMAASKRLREWRTRFLMVGRRTDLDISEPWDFAEPSGRAALRSLALSKGKLDLPTGMDYFLFTRDVAENILPFALGRGWFDWWLIWHARTMRAPVVDATAAVLAIHQNHDYSHHAQGLTQGLIGIIHGTEGQRNRALLGWWWRHYTVADATHLLVAGQVRRNFRRSLVQVQRAAKRTRTFLTWYGFLDATLPLRHRLGLRRHRRPAAGRDPGFTPTSPGTQGSSGGGS